MQMRLQSNSPRSSFWFDTKISPNCGHLLRQICQKLREVSIPVAVVRFFQKSASTVLNYTCHCLEESFKNFVSGCGKLLKRYKETYRVTTYSAFPKWIRNRKSSLNLNKSILKSRVCSVIEKQRNIYYKTGNKKSF